MSKETISEWINTQAEQGRLCFTKAEIGAQFSHLSPMLIKQSLQRACRARSIAIAWQGFYLILPREYQGVGMLPVSEYIGELMTYLGRPYCVTLLNAAALYGAAHQRPMTFAVMTSDPKPRNSRWGNNSIVFVSKRGIGAALPEELTRVVKTQYSRMVVATPEFTACSLVQYAKMAGGLSNVLNVLSELVEACRFDSLPSCLRDFVPTPCLQRLGYMLEQLLGEDEAADHLFRYLTNEKKSPRLTPLAPSRPIAESPRDNRWGIIINTQIDTDFDD